MAAEFKTESYKYTKTIVFNFHNYDNFIRSNDELFYVTMKTVKGNSYLKELVEVIKPKKKEREVM